MNPVLFQSLLFPSATTPVFPDSALAVFYMFLKIMFVIAAILYLIFAFVVVRQIHVMKSTVITPLSGFIQLIGFLHLFLAVGVVLLFITIL